MNMTLEDLKVHCQRQTEIFGECVDSRAYLEHSMVLDLITEHENRVKYDTEERIKILDELENKLRIWDHGANAIPNYVWKCIEEMKN